MSCIPQKNSAPSTPEARPGAERFVLDDQVAHLLRRAHQRAAALFLSALAEAQLTPTQFFAMARLHERGKLSQNRLGRLAAMDPATILGVIRRLHKRGMIERLADPTERRRMVLRLSPQGEELATGPCCRSDVAGLKVHSTVQVWPCFSSSARLALCERRAVSTSAMTPVS